MTGDTHARVSLVTSAVATAVLKPDVPHAATGFVLALVSSAIPDWVQVNIPFVQIKGFEGHRAFSHWLLTALASTLLLYPHIGYDLAVYWLAGYVSHLVLDVMTGYGIYLLGPLPRMVSLPVARNGDSIERWLNSLAVPIAVMSLAVGIFLG